MRKIILLITTLLLTAFVLGACNTEDSTESENSEAETGKSNESTDSAENSEEDTTNENETDEVDKSNEDAGSNNGIFEVTEEEQLDLKIGDTGTVQTSIGTYELTVDSAKIVTELDGEESMLEELIILDLTFKNTDDKAIVAEDIMSMMGITDNFDGSNNHNSAEGFPSIEEFSGELAPGEERQTQFIADIYEADKYYFRQDQGNVAAGTSNQVMWTITAEEAGK